MNKADLGSAAVAGLLAMAVYAWTTAPSVTFKDSGELIVAAVQQGVPHPTGYPLWTFLAGLFSWLLPLGSAAYEVNLFSGVCAAFATALIAALVSNLGRFLGRSAILAGGIAIPIALVFAFSVCVWSQAVFAEVYTLHIAVAAVFWWCIYRWFRAPSWRHGFLVSVFLLALGMSNHHLMLALAPIPLLVAFWCHRRAGWELAGYSAAAGALLFLGFGALSAQANIWQTALRTSQLAVVGIVILILMRSRLVAWRTGLWILPTILLGLLPYLYMPLASSTNPPMNWGYTSTSDGFFYSVNRSPYRGPLTAQLQGTLGRLVGTAEESVQEGPSLGERLALLGGFAWRYLQETTKSFTSLTWILVMAALWVARRAGPARPWILLLGAGFLLSAFFQPASAALAGSAGRLEWLLQMPYLGYSYIPLALLAGLGGQVLAGWLGRRRIWAPTALAASLLLLPGIGLERNHTECSQRKHWFAMDFGREMMDPMPKGSVLFGGSDPGRFIPTYLIFGESFEKQHLKKDPEFDRRDVYLITQTQLYSRFYRQYIRDHYGPNRPEVSLLGRWLGRHEQYPEKPLVLPTEEQVAEIIGTLSERELPINRLAPALAEWIYLNNRDEHDFFVEESIPMPWTKPYAIPTGPIVRLAHQPFEELSRDAAETNRAYWRERIEKLQQDPLFQDDFDAQVAYSDLRFRLARIYQGHGLAAYAEHAYLQALELLPKELNALATYSDFLARNGRPGEAVELIAKRGDDHPILKVLHQRAEEKATRAQRLGAAHTQFLLDPSDEAALQRVLALSESPETDSPRALRLRDDLLRWKERPGDPVVFRRILGAYRYWKLYALGDHLALRFLHENPSFSATRLIVADQLLGKPRLDDAGQALRVVLAQRVLDRGETELARNLLKPYDPEEEDIRKLLDRESRIRSAQTSLQPMLLRLAAVEEIPQATLEAIENPPTGEPQEVTKQVVELSRILRRYLKNPRSPKTLGTLVEALRQMRLVEDARGILAQQNEAKEEVLVRAVRLAAEDLLPGKLTALADALAQRGSKSRQAWFALAAYHLAANNQADLRAAIAELLELGSRTQLLERFRGDSVLAPLADDPRFLQFLDQEFPEESAA